MDASCILCWAQGGLPERGGGKGILGRRSSTRKSTESEVASHAEEIEKFYVPNQRGL